MQEFTDEELARIEHCLSDDGPPMFDGDYVRAAERLLVGVKQYREQNEYLMHSAREAHEMVKGLTDPHLLKQTQLIGCPTCERLNSRNNHFCCWCGEQLRTTCALCGHRLEASAALRAGSSHEEIV